MSENLITSGGLVQLARIFVSCRPLMGKILTPNQEYLISHAKIGEDVNFHYFKHQLPLPDDTYDKIMDFARSMGKESIDENVVWMFFGSGPHFEKISTQINDLKEYLKSGFAKKIYFAHILIPVEITGVDPFISAVYRNGKVKVKISHLVSTIKGAEISVGGKYLIHYASIIAECPDKPVEEYLLGAQAKRPDFMGACKFTEKLNYGKFWSLCEWTQDTIEKRGLML